MKASVIGSALGRDPRRCRRAFTLLEMMIVLVLMLGVMAIALPLTLQDARRAVYREVQEQCSAVLMGARADAQRTGKTVRVVAARGAGDERWMLRVEEVSSAGGLGAQPGVEDSGVRLMRETSLPAGVVIARSEDEAWGLESAGGEGEAGSDGLPGDAATDAPAGPGVSMGTEDGGAWVRVAIFLPDGQITASSSVYVRVEGSTGEALRVGRLTLNTWTGVATLAEVTKPRAGDAPADEPAAPEDAPGVAP